jgi:hypothetical protein
MGQGISALAGQAATATNSNIAPTKVEPLNLVAPSDEDRG